MAIVWSLIGAGVVVIAGKNWLRQTVREEIARENQPHNKRYEADYRFAADREEDGFRSLDEALKLYKQRVDSGGTPDEYEAMLHDYLHVLGHHTRKPELQQVRFERLMEMFKASGVSVGLKDQGEIGRFWFKCGDLEKSREQLEQLLRLAAANNDRWIEAEAHHLLMYCALAAGDDDAALRHSKLAEERDPNLYEQYVVRTTEEMSIRFASLYGPFADTVRRFNERLQGQLDEKP